VKLLLDTHAVLWFYLDDPQLSAVAKAAILDAANEKWVSPASYWEVAIKISIGKYAIAQPFEDFWHGAVDMNAFRVLPVSFQHAGAVSTLPYLPNNHRDPFDRMIVAQSLVEGMSVVSADGILDAYGITRIW
jgi:PIN domain nuclease of toxin-antitoxin system